MVSRIFSKAWCLLLQSHQAAIILCEVILRLSARFSIAIVIQQIDTSYIIYNIDHIYIYIYISIYSLFVFFFPTNCAGWSGGHTVSARFRVDTAPLRCALHPPWNPRPPWIWSISCWPWRSRKHRECFTHHFAIKEDEKNILSNL